ncbi:MAG: glycosyl hydrolase [Verrucomicrobiota bacterium]|nr:glycosyl hydrolase [Verrucomicrobiota bacterium]
MVATLQITGANFSDLESGFTHPPPEARLRAYWWWLNGNVTAEAITRDLEEMKAKGFGGAILCDADGSDQDGNARVPHGATFLSEPWLQFYRHALDEAARLGLEISLNIQSGWNLGGPMVKPEEAPKKLVWTALRVQGPTNGMFTLAQPESKDGYYRDLYALAYPLRTAPTDAKIHVEASSYQGSYLPQKAFDGDIASWWVSKGSTPGDGPQPDRPEWLELRFDEPVLVNAFGLVPRPGYGPREVEVQVSEGAEPFRSLGRFRVGRESTTRREFPPTQARRVRLVLQQSRDPRFPAASRNVQVAEAWLEGPNRLYPAFPGQARPLKNWPEKAMHRTLEPFSAPDSRPLFDEWPALADEKHLLAHEVQDLTDQMASGGRLVWTVPEGTWEILRLGYTLNDHCYVSTCSQGWEGYAIDPFDEAAFRRYWATVVEKLLTHAGPHVGRTLKYLHTDSWEIEVANWTRTLPHEFRQRRGYDLKPWLPVLAGRIVNSREESNRFLNDYRRTFGDLAIAHHYRLFREGAHRRGMLIHPESGGPHAVPIDAQQCLGFNDAPMSEFWAWSWRHRVGDANRFFVKQPASAAHTYGRRLVMAEGFTTIGPHWQETLWDNLKPSFDKACTEGLNLLVWHAFVCSPNSEGVPGQQYFAGTHLNPLVTWWEKSRPFFDYINRCQFLLQQGLFVADVAFYYGDHVPNFAQLKSSDPAGILPGYDYDVVTAEVLLNRMEVRQGRFVLPDGMSYRILVLRDLEVISPPVLGRLETFVRQGGIVVGPRPRSPGTLTGYPQVDKQFRKLVDELWGTADAPPPRLSPQGVKPRRIVSHLTAREVLRELGIPPDFEWISVKPDRPADIDYIHRRTQEADLYFVSHRGTNATSIHATFRVAGKAPELWDPVSGMRRVLPNYEVKDGRTSLLLEFPPCGSWFVVFRHPAEQYPPTGQPNFPRLQPVHSIPGPWTVRFDPKWSDLTEIRMDSLISWTDHPHPDIRHYSGTAQYETKFLWSASFGGTTQEVWLDLGDLRELAEVHINGQSCGIVWTPPFRVRIDGLLQPGENQLVIEVVNFWPNRLVGDLSLPPEKRRTRTNIRKFTTQTPLMRSGLFGPVQLLVAENDVSAPPSLRHSPN